MPLDVQFSKPLTGKRDITVIVCGGRNFTDESMLYAVLDKIHTTFTIMLLVNGAASGADGLSQKWAIERGINTKQYPADWQKLGRRAGPERNAQMLRGAMPDLVVAFPGGRGTNHMVSISTAAGIPLAQVRRS